MTIRDGMRAVFYAEGNGNLDAINGLPCVVMESGQHDSTIDFGTEGPFRSKEGFGGAMTACLASNDYLKPACYTRRAR